MAKDPVQTDSDGMLEELLRVANRGDEPARYWLERIAKHGVTKGLANKLTEELTGFPMIAHPAFNADTRSLEPNFEYPDLPEDVNIRTAFAVAVLLWEGKLDGLKRCALPAKIEELAKKYPSLRKRIRAGKFDCKNYVVKNSKGKWCSEKCGSHFRTTEKRESKKRSQML